MKLGQLIEYIKRNIFLQTLCRKWGSQTSSRALILKKCSIWGKSKWSTVTFQYILTALNLQYNKNKLYKTLNCWSRDTLNFNFPEKGLGLDSPPQFVYGFPTKMFLKLYSIKWQFSLSDFLYFLLYWTIICVLQLFVNQAVTSQNLKLTLSF